MSARPRLLLFDLDGVLAQYDRHARCAYLAQAAGTDADSMHEALFGEAQLELRSDQGEFDLQGLLDALHAHRGWKISPGDFLQARRRATRVEAEMLALCAAAAEEAELAMFTNNGRWLAEHAGAIVPELLPLFAGRMVCAGHLRLCKPEPEAYRACLERLDAQAAETLFIDDRADNVEGARSAGLRAVLFENIPTLRAQLRHHGLLGGAGHEN
jgi:putative hydrolase of the HAD superfamily